MNYDRKLTSSEQAMEILNQHNGSFNVITISQIQGKLPENIVIKSLDLVQLNPSETYKPVSIILIPLLVNDGLQ